MALIPYTRRDLFANPWKVFDEMDNLQRDWFADPRKGSITTDIHETDNAYVLEADLPGFKKEDIHVDVSDNTLTISAERHSEHEDKDKKGSYIRCERSYGSFARSFSLDGVDANGIQAGFTDGVLTLTLPKLIEQKPASRRLTIE